MKLKIQSLQLLKGGINKGALCLIITLLVLLQSNAQTVDTSVANATNTVFAPLEKHRIPHNILLDYGIEFIDISKYDGVLRSDNYTSTVMYKDMYTTLISSATASGVSGFAAPVTEDTQWQNLQTQENNLHRGSNTTSLILSGLYYNYSKIRADALSTNKIQVVNGKYDDKYIGGVWQNPYETKIGFAITAPVQQIHKHTVKVFLPTTLWHTNATISNIAVDLGNGTGYKNLNSGATATATYTSTGVKTWTYRIQLSNGQYKYCRQKVNVTVANSGGVARSSSCPIDDDENITATRAYLGQFGSASLQIAYGSNDCKLRKPLIVAEGLDTGFFAATGSMGDTDYFSFFNSIDDSESDNLRNLITNDTSIDYDVVYVNWDNGTDYIQRNAYVLQAVINWVNQQKASNGSTEPNVVLGQSMGGLIARYALRDMENRSENHDTSLYISHDAPHQGAHVPLGLWYMARHAVDQFVETPLGDFVVPLTNSSLGIGSAIDLLDAPAVKQMVKKTVTAGFSVDDNIHTSWQTELRNMGYPQQTRNVALSNASHCASIQDVTAGSRIFTLDAFGKTSFLTDIVMSATGLGAVSGILSAFLLDEVGFLLNILPGNSRFDMDFWVNAYPSTGTQQIYYGKVTYRKTLLWLVPITSTLTNRSYNSPTNTLPLDSYPGGVNPAFQNIDINVYESGLLGKYGFTVDLEPNFGFIPVASALDVGSNNTTLSAADYIKVYTKANPPTGNRTIPFQNFTTSYNTSSINEPHISFNRLNGDWLAEELDADSNTDVFNCSYICGNSKITGPSSICTSGSFSVSSGAPNYNWSITEGSGLVSLSGTGASVVLNKIGSSSGYVTIQVQYGDNGLQCGNVTLTKRVWAGAPEVSRTFPGQPRTLCQNYYSSPESTFSINAEGIPSSTAHSNWEWVSVSNNFIFYTSKNTIYITPYQVGALAFKVRVRNACGWSDYAKFQFQVIDCGSGGGPRFRVAPNPTSGTLIIANTERSQLSENNTFNTFNSTATSRTVNTFHFYDFSGNLVLSGQLSDITNIDVSKFKKGTYILKIDANGNEDTHQIVIE